MKQYLLMSWMLFVSITLSAQNKAAKNLKQKADDLLNKGDFPKALRIYEQLRKDYAKDIEHKFLLGKCYLKTNQLPLAVEYLTFCVQQRPNWAEAHLRLGEAHHLLHQFEIAGLYYKNFLRKSKDNPIERQSVKKALLQCVQGVELSEVKRGAIITPLGDQINTEYNEYALCFHPKNVNNLLFTSNVHNLQDDIFSASLERGAWKNKVALDKKFNSTLPERMLAFQEDGHQLIFEKSFSSTEQLCLVDNHDSLQRSLALPFQYRDAVSIQNIGDSIFILASNQWGGYGGYDLFFANVNSKGEWSAPQNLGPNINSEENEISPHLAGDGFSLYFSSDRTDGVGGYDIYKASFDVLKGHWMPAQNLGMPLNSGGDERDFILGSKGAMGYFSSSRAESKGGLDLFAVYFREPERLFSTVEKQQKYNFIAALKSQSLIDSNSLNNEIKLGNIDPFQQTTNPQEEEEKEDLSIAPLYYKVGQGLDNRSRNDWRKIIKVCKQDKKVQLLLTVHSNQETQGQKGNACFLSIAEVQTLITSLESAGVDKSRITVQGCGGIYPMVARKNFDGSVNPTAELMNRRIAVAFFNLENSNFNVTIKEPMVNKIMADKSYERYVQQLEGLTYRIKLTTTTILFEHPILLDFEHVVAQRKGNQVPTDYLVALEKEYKSARILLNKVKTEGFEQAIIVPYINGQPINRKIGEAFLVDYPDLKEYLKSEN